MSQHDEFLISAEEFSGTARLFPLPNVVLFPHVMQPLQIYETRYLEMLDDALADDRLLAMALLEPGWELEYEGRPPVAPVVCVGRVVSHQPLDDGRQNILLVGLKRARIVSEVSPRRPYREATVELLDDLCPAESGAARASLQRSLLNILRTKMPEAAGKDHPFEAVFAGDMPLGMLTDLVTYMLPFDLLFKQSMLAEMDVERRARKLLKHLDGLDQNDAEAITQDAFPPMFSAN